MLHNFFPWNILYSEIVTALHYDFRASFPLYGCMYSLFISFLHSFFAEYLKTKHFSPHVVRSFVFRKNKIKYFFHQKRDIHSHGVVIRAPNQATSSPGLTPKKLSIVVLRVLQLC